MVKQNNPLHICGSGLRLSRHSVSSGRVTAGEVSHLGGEGVKETYGKLFNPEHRDLLSLREIPVLACP